MPWFGFDLVFGYGFSQCGLTRLVWFVLKGYIRFVWVDAGVGEG